MKQHARQGPVADAVHQAAGKLLRALDHVVSPEPGDRIDAATIAADPALSTVTRAFGAWKQLGMKDHDVGNLKAKIHTLSDFIIDRAEQEKVESPEQLAPVVVYVNNRIFDEIAKVRKDTTAARKEQAELYFLVDAFATVLNLSQQMRLLSSAAKAVDGKGMNP